jgi:hypothetical protein
MRDFWYEVVKEKWPTAESRNDKERLSDLLLEVQHGELEKRDELIDELRKKVDKLEEEFDRGDVGDAQDVVESVVSGTRIGDNVYANVHCRKCNSYTGMLIGSDRCTTCGTPIGS